MDNTEVKIKKNRNIPLSFKLGLLLVVVITIVSVVLINIHYQAYWKVTYDQIYKNLDYVDMTDPDTLDMLSKAAKETYIITHYDGYAELHEQAVEAGDSSSLVQWLIDHLLNYFTLEYMSQTHKDELMEQYIREASAAGYSKDDIYDWISLYHDEFYNYMPSPDFIYSAFIFTQALADQEDITHIGIYVEENGGYLQLVDAEASNAVKKDFNEVLACGVPLDDVPAITTYKKKKEAHLRIKTDRGNEVARVEPLEIEGVEYYFVFYHESDKAVEGQASFIRNGIYWALGMAALAIIIGLTILRRMITRPLKHLARAVDNFSLEDVHEQKAAVIDLPIRSRDEIGTLYNNIRSMETRIINDSDNITRMNAEKERIGMELELAEKIQKNSLPSTFPAFPDHKEFDLYASMDPAKEVGGDFYDYYMIDDNHLALAIADVSGKGVPASLFMMVSKILLENNAMSEYSPAEILKKTNRQICRNNPEGMFVTIWLGIIDLRNGKMSACSAGHEYPYIKKPKGDFEMLKDKHGLMAGYVPEYDYNDYELTFEPGSKLFVYTDGVPEAANAKGERYGQYRLTAALKKCGSEKPEKILHQVRENVDFFVGDSEQFDDLTMLCFEFRGR